MREEISFEELAGMTRKSATHLNVSIGFCLDIIDVIQEIFVVDRPEAVEIVKKITGDILRLDVRPLKAE